MENRIDAQVEFSFRGEIYTPSATIDLDKLMAHHGSVPPLHAFLAEQNGIDTYSYLYEAMLEAPILFSNAQGLAADFLIDGLFDASTFASRWQENRVLRLLQAVARRELGIDHLEQHPELRQALVQVYSLGKTDASRNEPNP